MFRPEIEPPEYGYCDRVTPSIVEGWAYDPAEPSIPMVMEAVIDGKHLFSVECNRPRYDKSGQAIMPVGFQVPIPTLFRDGLDHRIEFRKRDGSPIALRDSAGLQYRWTIPAAEGAFTAAPGSSAILGNLDPVQEHHASGSTSDRDNPDRPVTLNTKQDSLSIAAADTASVPTTLEAHIDAAEEDGMVVGWCWDRAQPTRRVVLNLLVDGVIAVSTVAGLFREGLHAAGKGDGNCSFKVYLPWTVIADRSQAVVTLQDADTGIPLGVRATLRRPSMVPAEKRIEALERQLKMLSAELHASELRAHQGQHGRSAPELFRLVAGFFNDLAEGRPVGSLVSLRARLDDAAERLPLVSLSLPRAPELTLFVLPDGGLDRLHACLHALHNAGADERARIVVLDRGDADEAAVIHAAVRNLSLLRLNPGESIAAMLGSRDIALAGLLSSHVRVNDRWLPTLLGLLDAHPDLMMAIGRLDSGLGEPSVNLDTDFACAVVRTAALGLLDNLDPSFNTLAAAVIDLLARARQAGLSMVTSQEVLGTTEVPSSILLDQMSTADMLRLRSRC